MSMVGLFDARANWYRIGSGTTTLGGVPAVPTKIGTVRGTLQMQRLGTHDEGVGSRRVGEATFYYERKVTLLDEDVLYLTSGPNRGTWWSVVAPFNPSRGSHNETFLKPYIGQKPSV